MLRPADGRVNGRRQELAGWLASPCRASHVRRRRTNAFFWGTFFPQLTPTDLAQSGRRSDRRTQPCVQLLQLLPFRDAFPGYSEDEWRSSYLDTFHGQADCDFPLTL